MVKLQGFADSPVHDDKNSTETVTKIGLYRNSLLAQSSVVMWHWASQEARNHKWHRKRTTRRGL